MNAKPFSVTHVLAPTDLSDSSLPALLYARLFAERFSARLTVMYTDPIVYPVDLNGSTDALIMTATPDHEAELRRELELHAAPVMEGRTCDLEIMVGRPVSSILAAASRLEADLIVTGTHLRHGWRRALLGSVSEGVMHGSRVPVLTVGAQDHLSAAEPHGVVEILCPVNFTDVARDAVLAAVELSAAFGAHLTLVHVLEPDEMVNETVDEERVRRWIAPELQDICSYRALVLRGGPAERVLDCADDIGADLLVVGAQHKLFRDATVIGTTTERLIRFAACPVLVVPRAADRRTVEVETDRELVVAER